jgi:hypothetical protein
MDLKAACPVYGTDYSKSGPDYIMHGDQKIAARAFAGALDWSPYVMFKLVFREAIAEHFNAKGVTTRKGRRWTGATVVKFLGSPGAKPCRSGGKDGPQGDVKG